MTDPKFHSIQDELGRLSPVSTITASGNSNVYDNGATWAPNMEGVACSVDLNVSALKTTAGNETYTVKAQESSDGSTWVDISNARTILATGPMTFGIFIKLRYQRIVLTLGGTSPSMTFEAFLNFQPSA